MLTWLAEFSHHFSPLNLFRYITFRTGGATATALFFVFFFGPRIIAALRIKQGKGQPIRSDGPPIASAHKDRHADDGRADDPIGSHRIDLALGQSREPLCVDCSVGDGRLRSHRLLRRLSESDAAVARRSFRPYAPSSRSHHRGHCLLRDDEGGNGGTRPALALPAIKGYVVDLGVLFLVFGPFIIIAAGNAVNLTDGLDGLAIVPVMIAAATFGIIAYLAGNAIFSLYLGINFVPGAGELAVVCGALIGAGLGFLWFNAPPAQIFMGDTGSLALGGLLGTIAVAIKHEIVLAIVGGLFVVEALSVIVQVVSFKLTGRRVFKMAPIHHHFEQLGWSEPQVVVRFWIIAFVLALVGLSTLKLR